MWKSVCIFMLLMKGVKPSIGLNPKWSWQRIQDSQSMS